MKRLGVKGQDILTFFPTGDVLPKVPTTFPQFLGQQVGGCILSIETQT